MNIQKLLSLQASILILSTSCGLPKSTIQFLDTHPKEAIEFPIDHAMQLPTPTFEQWDKDYNTFERYLTDNIMRTQVGLSFENDGVQTWWCYPSARTHAQLDTATMIRDKKTLKGNWRIVTHRRITFTDSASHADRKIYRHSNLDETYHDDVYLSIDEGKFRLYAKPKDKNDFSRIGNKNYDMESNRYLMLYGVAKAGAAISQMGIDKNGHLIINSNYVAERKVKGKYITYQATVTQMIFKRMA